MAPTKTRIPLPGSKLPTSAMQSTQSSSSSSKIVGTMSSVNRSRPLLSRRSKSYTNLASTCNYKPLDDIKNKLYVRNPTSATLTKSKLRRSMSSADIPKIVLKNTDFKMKRPDIKKTTTVPVNKPVKPIFPPKIQPKGVKRVAESKDQGETKPKVPKPARIPPYDYKARFNALTEKHTKLSAQFKELKEKMASSETIQERYDQLLNEYNSLRSNMEIQTIECAKLEEETKTLVAKLNSLSEEFEISKQNYKVLFDSHKNLTENHRKLTEDNLKNSEIIVDLKSELNSTKKHNTELLDTVDHQKQELRRNGEIIRNMHNTIQDLKGKIRVICRVRPPLHYERSVPLCNITFVDEATIEIRKSCESYSVTGKPTDYKMEFNFDKVFGPESSQKEVFEDLSHLVRSALDGYHVCVFAYGQTGSGKTYTMQGEMIENHKGMIPQAVELIFNSIADLQKQQGWIYTIQASFLEIYNETIKDLLDPKSKETLDIQHNDGKSIGVRNLTITNVENAEDLLYLMQVANRNRATAATNFNEHSSRSHAVTKIYIQGVQDDSSVVLSGSLNLVDLAGSESAKTSERMTETKSINKSLSTLGQVMLALHNKDTFIPYRNSKLTHLLQNCLGGNSKTLMFVNISPFDECYSESINSLRFASKVKEVKMNVKRNKGYNKADTSSSSLK